MSEIEIRAVNPPGGAPFDDEDDAAATADLTNWLCLAAAPTFAIMPTGLDGSPMDKSARPGLASH